MADTNALKQMLEKTKGEIDVAQKALAKAQEDQQRRNEKKAALEAMLAESAKSEQAIGAQRKAAEADVQDAHMALAGLKGQLEKRIPPDVRTQIGKTVAIVLNTIEQCRTPKGTAEERLRAAELAKHAADTEVADSEVEYQGIRTRLQQLVGEISAAKSGVATLKEKAKTATADSRRTSEAWWLVLDLQAAIVQLENVLGQEDALWRDFEAKGRALEDSRDRALETKREVTRCRAALEEAETKLKEVEQGREKAIQELLQQA